jgi:hypothetical protein
MVAASLCLWRRRVDAVLAKRRGNPAAPWPFGMFSSARIVYPAGRRGRVRRKTGGDWLRWSARENVKGQDDGEK